MTNTDTPAELGPVIPKMPRMLLPDVALQLLVRGECLLDGIQFFALDGDDNIVATAAAAKDGSIDFTAERDAEIVRVVTDDERVIPLTFPQRVRRGDVMVMSPIHDALRSALDRS